MVKFTGGAVLTIVVAEPARVLLMALGLDRARKEHPTLFDGELAITMVEEALKEALLVGVEEFSKEGIL